MKKIGYILLAIGIIIGAYGISMDTTVSTGGQTIESGDLTIKIPNTRVQNIGLLEDRRIILYGAGLSLVLGVLFIGFGTLSENNPQHTNIAPPKQPQDKLLSPLQSFISGDSISSKDVESLALLAEQHPSIVEATSRTNGNTLLHLAASYGLHNAAELLLKAGSDKNRSNGNAQRAHQLAKDHSLAELLREKG
jgi:hypothetical protein